MAAAAAGGAGASVSDVDLGIGDDPITLTRYLLGEQKKSPHATGDFTIVMSSIQLACKVIASAVRKAGIAGLYGLQGAVNVQGEDVKKLDIVSNDNFVRALQYSHRVSVMVSEEVEEPIVVDAGMAGTYSVVFDPLDGSSNIDCNVSVGSIFGIYRNKKKGPGSLDDVLQPGTELVAAGYTMYGSSTQLVLAIQHHEVNIFTLDPSIGDFLLTHKNVRMPAKPKTIYSVNEGNFATFPEAVKRFIGRCKGEEGGKPWSARYVGSMVADVHRTLVYGGIFMYPATASAPEGKLRLLYEGNPMSMIIETAGGKASTGTGRVREIKPTKIHERCPIFIGSAAMVDEIEALFKEQAEAEAKAAAGAAAAGGGAGGAGGDAEMGAGAGATA